MKRRTLTVVSAGLSQPTSTRLLADQLAVATREALDGRDVALETQVVELRDHAREVTNHLLTGFPSSGLKPAIDAVTGADGLIVVTPIFNASYSGLFKSFFDILPEGSLAGRPVLLGATGGTARHSLALEHAMRPMFAYLRAVVVPTGVFAATEDWAGATPEAALRGRVRRAGGELADLLDRTAPAATADPFALSTSFEQLLAGE